MLPPASLSAIRSGFWWRKGRLDVTGSFKDKSWQYCQSSNPLGETFVCRLDSYFCQEQPSHTCMEWWLLGKKPCLLSDYSPQQVTEDQRAPCAEISTLFTITKSTTNPGVAGCKTSWLRLHVSWNISPPGAVNVTHLQSNFQSPLFSPTYQWLENASSCNASTPLHQGNGDKLVRSLQNYISWHSSPRGPATHEKCQRARNSYFGLSCGLFTALE